MHSRMHMLKLQGYKLVIANMHIVSMISQHLCIYLHIYISSYLKLSLSLNHCMQMPRKLKFYQTKNSERKRNVRKLQAAEDAEDCSCSNDTFEHNTMHTPAETVSGWSKQTLPDATQVFYKISEYAKSAKSMPLSISHCLQINPDSTWSLFVHNHQLHAKKCSALSFPQAINTENIEEMLNNIDSLSVCTGQKDSHFVQMVQAKKDKTIVSPNGKVAAYTEECVVGGNIINTIRTSECELLCTTTICPSCQGYRATLRTMYNRWSKKLYLMILIYK